jgi:hypothetical protein
LRHPLRRNLGKNLIIVVDFLSAIPVGDTNTDYHDDDRPRTTAEEIPVNRAKIQSLEANFSDCLALARVITLTSMQSSCAKIRTLDRPSASFLRQAQRRVQLFSANKRGCRLASSLRHHLEILDIERGAYETKAIRIGAVFGRGHLGSERL